MHPFAVTIDTVLHNVWALTALHVAVGVVAAIVLTAIVGAIFRGIARRRGWPDRSVGRLRRPFRILLVVIAAWVGVDTAIPKSMRTALDHGFDIVTIAVAGWFVATIVSFFVDVGLTRYRVDVRDNAVARRIQTQVLVIRRIAIVVIVIIAVASILLTFNGAQAAGASLLASAGIISIIAGVAAQSTLGNVIAGIQLAFSGAIRMDDVVIANGEWGKIEEITLTYVVVHIWDDRRMVLPSTYFTTTPFENWTRTGSELMQAVEFDLDWRVDPGGMRDEMHRILERTKLWDRRVAVLQVTDAVGGMVHIRILVTAIDAPTLFDLRCFVREELVRWLQQQTPQALPRTRVEMVDGGEDPPVTRPTRDRPADRALFTGDNASARRGSQFTGPVSLP